MTTHTLLALSLGLAGVIFTTQHLHAAPACGDRDAFALSLAATYGEELRAVRQVGAGRVRELFASTGTWTLIETDMNGTACLISTGRLNPRAPEAPLPVTPA